MFQRSVPLFLCAALIGACAGEGDVDRTQPNRMPKSMFEGTWYIRSTVTEVPGTSGVSFIGNTGTMDKIRWEIQENNLIAYRAYEEIPGTDPQGQQTQTPEDYRENPVASFAISSHFDVQRQYNAATGEQTNVIVENATDRPWHERDYIRVDWSRSQIDSQQFFGAFAPARYNEVFYVQQHENDDDAMRVIGKGNQAVNFDQLSTIIDTKPGAWGDKIEYFDMVGRFLLEPESMQLFLSGGRLFDVPICWFYGFETNTCGSAEVKVRTSFMRADERNYEPVELRPKDMAKFGYFRTERYTRDKLGGIREDGRIFLANIHNIWEAAYETDESGKIRKNESGEPVRIPLAARTPSPIVYHLNKGYPCEMVSTAQQVAQGWNRTFRRSVAVAKGMLTHSNGGDELAGVDKTQVPDMFVLNLNGWRQKVPGDNYSCENLQWHEEDVEALVGDLRYNIFAWVGDRQLSGPLGYGPSSADPETGEIVAGMAYVYGAAIDTYAYNSLEIIRMLNDDLEFDALVSGESVRDYAIATREAVDPLALPTDIANLPVKDLHKASLPLHVQSRLQALKNQGPQLATEADKHRKQRIRGTELEQAMIDEEIKRAMIPALAGNLNIGQGDSVSGDVLSQISPLSWTSEDFKALQKMRTDRAAKQNLWLADFSDDAIQGLALEVWEKFYRTGEQQEYEAMWQYLREKIFRGVMEHEVGHTVGLRHNFAGSYDSINFHNEYWDLRTSGDENGLGEMPQYDPLSENPEVTLNQLFNSTQQNEAQIRGKMREYQYSSIMDYGARFNSDIHGLGKYDHAAILFGYTGHVEVFDAPTEQATGVMHQRYADCASRFESRPTVAYPPLLEQFHYGSIWNIFGRNEGLRSRRFKPWSEVRAEQNSARAACELHIQDGGNMVEFTTQMDTGREVEVPFMFCSDEYVGVNLSCHRWDQGADPNEIVDNVIDSYKEYYFFNNYKRGRVGFNAFDVYRRVSGRYFSYLPNVYQHWLFRTIFDDVDDEILQFHWNRATFRGLNMLLDVVSTPEYGTYCRHDENGDCTEDGTMWGRISRSTEPTEDANRAVIGRGQGRRYFSRYDVDFGYYFSQQVLEAGHFFEYLAALDALTQSTGTFAGVDQTSDFATYLIPYYLVFENDLTRYFEGTIVGDYARFAPRMANGQLMMQPALTMDFNNGLSINPETGESVPPEAFRPGQPVDLDSTFSMRFYSLLYGMADFRSNYSLHFADRQQIFRLGSGEQIQPGEGRELVTCADPTSGAEYAAIRSRDTNSNQPSAVKMVERCQTQVDRFLQLEATANNSTEYFRARADMNDNIRWMNFMRAFYEYFGNNL